MANNRMYLKNKITGEKVMLAKYYPSTGWYVQLNNLTDVLNKAFYEREFGHLSEDQHNQNTAHKGLGVPHPSVNGMYGGNEWIIEYQVIDDDQPFRP